MVSTGRLWIGALGGLTVCLFAGAAYLHFSSAPSLRTSLVVEPTGRDLGEVAVGTHRIEFAIRNTGTTPRRVIKLDEG